MRLRDGDPDDKVVLDPAELVSGKPSARGALGVGDDTDIVRARGTREQLEIPAAALSAAPLRTIRKLGRDPVEVLRAWPHSMAAGTSRGPVMPPAAEPARPRVAGKTGHRVALAHLAIDLLHEVEQIEAGTPQRSPETAHPAHGACSICDLRINELRGALIEACLLIQRVVKTTPAIPQPDIEDRIRELLDLIDGGAAADR